MFKSTIESCVKQAINQNCKSEFVKPDELEKVLADAIYAFAESRDFVQLIDEKLGEQMRRAQR